MKKKPARKSNKKTLIFIVIALILIALFSKTIIRSVSFFYGLFFTKEIQLKKQQGSINILLLGIGGGKHEGPDLTDTIIVAHINPLKNTAQLFSIPRDLWISDIGSKINGAYANGQEKGGKGILLAKTVVQKVTGLPIDYVIVLDFAGFIKMVDELGGLDVHVHNTFDDYLYPDEGRETDLCGKSQDDAKAAATLSAELDIAKIFPCRYRHIHFDKGISHMDGQTALTFVRSRHAEGIEGSDFARSVRQHEVIAALKKKVFSLGLLLNPIKVISIATIIRSHLNTDIDSSEYDDFIKLARKMEKAKIQTYVLDTGGGDRRYGLLVNPPIEETRYQWALTPRVGSGNFSEIHEYIDCLSKNISGVCVIEENGIRKEQVSPTSSVRKE